MSRRDTPALAPRLDALGEAAELAAGRLPEDVVAALVRAGVGVRGFTVARPSLEEQFVGLTGDGFEVSGG